LPVVAALVLQHQLSSAAAVFLNDFKVKIIPSAVFFFFVYQEWNTICYMNGFQNENK
jgi:hypothetical protein